MTLTVTPTSTIQQLIDKSIAYDNEKAWYPVPISGIQFTDTGVVLPEQLGLSVPPLFCTEHAWDQIYSKMGIAVYGKGSARTLPKDYMVRIPPDLRAHSLNVLRGKLNGGSWLVSQYQTTCRAVLGRDYPYQMGNTKQLEMAAEAFESHGYPSFFRHSVTPDRLWLKLLWAEVHTPDGPYGTGVFMSGSELGNGARKIYALLKRTKCDNSIIFGEGVEVAHNHRFEIMKGTLLLGIAKALEAAGKALGKITDAMKQEIPAFADLAAAVAKDQGFTNDQIRLFNIGTEAQTTRMGFVNGLTYMAQHANLEEEEQYRYEMLAGAILDGKDGLFTKALSRASLFE